MIIVWTKSFSSFIFNLIVVALAILTSHPLEKPIILFTIYQLAKWNQPCINYSCKNDQFFQFNWISQVSHKVSVHAINLYNISTSNFYNSIIYLIRSYLVNLSVSKLSKLLGLFSTKQNKLVLECKYTKLLYGRVNTAARPPTSYRSAH